MADIVVTPPSPSAAKVAADAKNKPATLPKPAPTPAELVASPQLTKWMPGLKKNLEKMGVVPETPKPATQPDPTAIAPVTPPEPPRPIDPPVTPPAPTTPPEPTPEGKKRKVNKPPTGMAPEEVGRIAAEAAVAVVNRVNTPTATAPKPTPAADPLEGLTETQRNELEITQELERLNPKKYQGLSERAPTYYRALNALETERDKKIAELKGDDASIDEVIRDYEQREEKLAKRHGCDDVPEIDRSKAYAALAARPLQEEVARLKAAEAERQRQAFVQQVAPKITASATTAAEEAAEQLAGRKVKLENGTVPDEEYVALDPDAANIIRQSTAMVRNVAATVHGAFAGVGDQNAVNWTRDRILEAEARVLAMTPAQRREEDPDGSDRTFVTLDQWNQLPPQQRSAYWTTDAEYVVEAYATNLVKTGKAEIDRLAAVRKAHAKPAAPTPKPIQSPAMTTSIPAPNTTSIAPTTPSNQLGKWFPGAAKKAAAMKT